MFKGAAELSLDPKGRLSIPTKHRDGLAAGGGITLTAHPERCVLVFPRDVFEARSAALASLSSLGATNRWWRRAFVGFAEEVELDGSGRVLISPALRKFAGLDKKVILVGQGSHLELWDTDTWDRNLENALPAVAAGEAAGADGFAL